HYEVWLDNVKITTVKTTQYALTTGLTSGSHSWYVKAVNWANGITQSSTFTFTFQDTTAPNAFDLVAPANASTVTGSTQTLVWESSYDTGAGLHHYEVWLDGANVATVNSTGQLPNAGNLALNKPA